MSKGTQYTGPGSAIQGPVSSDEQGNGSELYMLVLNDIMARADFGARKYGHPLRDTAGVDFLVNAYQEVLDLLIYLRGEIALREKDPRDDLLEAAWGLIANAGWNVVTGTTDHDKSPGWHEAAVRFRDQYTAYLHQVTPDASCTESPVDKNLTSRGESGIL